tara:strand:- start:1672 stop:2817 length:1146 start_codon:yes stop_codon:yes gene_type:complete
MDLNFDLEDRYKAGLRKWDKYGPGFIPAWVAEHDFGCPPAVHERLSHVLSLGAFGYHDEDRKLGESFAFWADSRNSWKLNPERVIPTVTVLQGVAACVEAFSSVGDGILYNTPSYPPFLDLPSHAKRRSVEWPLIKSESGWHYDMDSLEKILKADRDIRILLLCNPHNPTGVVLKESELSQIVNLCHKYNLTLLSDEIHSDFIYKESSHIPTLTIDGADSVAVSLTSGAKSFALAGMRCAVAVPGNDILKKKLLEVPKFLLGGANRMGCVATIGAWETGHDWMDELIRTLDDRRLHLKSRLDGEIPEIKMFLPDSTFLAWIDLSEFNPGEKPAKWLREKTGVACGNGPDFGSGGENHVRLTFGTSANLLDEMIERIIKGLT